MAERRGTGVVVGKFNPPHLGHLHLIERGAATVDRLFVMLCERPDQTLPVAKRRAWVEEAAPANVTVVVTPDDLPEENEPWARRALEILPEPPTIAFTSEAWGPEWARLLGAEHVMVDQARTAHPISGTVLRADLRSHFEWLVPAARAELARRVVVVGAESTGKTTLARALGEALQTVWVPEHGRVHWEGRRYLRDQRWSSTELLRVAVAQRRHEDDLARQAVGGVLIADTDALVTAAWHERYVGAPPPGIDGLAAATVPDLYLLCGLDAAWVQDGTRESKQQRAAMQRSMRDRAGSSGAEVVALDGPHAARMEVAMRAIERIATFGALR